jgi:hypothetical protein
MGCATTPTQQPSPASEKGFEPKLAKFTAPAPLANLGEGSWIGSYTGTVDVFIGEEERWQKGSPISLFVQPDDQEGKLRLLGHVMLTAGRRSFYIGDIDEPPGNTIAGEYTDGGILVTTKYIYALNLSGLLVAGTVKTLVRRGDEGPFRPADEWRFDAERRSTFDLR